VPEQCIAPVPEKIQQKVTKLEGSVKEQKQVAKGTAKQAKGVKNPEPVNVFNMPDDS